MASSRIRDDPTIPSSPLYQFLPPTPADDAHGLNIDAPMLHTMAAAGTHTTLESQGRSMASIMLQKFSTSPGNSMHHIDVPTLRAVSFVRSPSHTVKRQDIQHNGTYRINNVANELQENIEEALHPFDLPVMEVVCVGVDGSFTVRRGFCEEDLQPQCISSDVILSVVKDLLHSSRGYCPVKLRELLHRLEMANENDEQISLILYTQLDLRYLPARIMMDREFQQSCILNVLPDLDMLHWKGPRSVIGILCALYAMSTKGSFSNTMITAAGYTAKDAFTKGLSASKNATLERLALKHAPSTPEQLTEAGCVIRDFCTRISLPVYLLWSLSRFRFTILMLVIMVLAPMDIYTATPSTASFRSSLLLSRITARYLIILTFFSIFLMCKYTVGLISQTRLGWILGIHENLATHRIAGTLTFVCSWLHTIGHIATAVHVLTEPLAQTNKYLKTPLPDNSLTYVLFRTWAYPTGILLCIVILVMTYGIMVKSKKYDTFLVTHNCGIFLFVILSVMHGQGKLVKQPFSQYIMLPPLALFIAEKIWLRWRMFTTTATIHLDANSYFMDISFDAGIRIPSGSYVYVYDKSTFAPILTKPKGDTYRTLFEEKIRDKFHPKLFSISGARKLLRWFGVFVWHPFSVSSCSVKKGGNVRLIVSAVGNTTRRLFEVASIMESGSEAKVEVSVTGGIRGPLTRMIANKYDIVCLVASGVGITPILSIISDETQRKKLCEGRFAVEVIWLTRSKEMVERCKPQLLEFIEYASSMDVIVNIKIYASYKASKAATEPLPDGLEIIHSRSDMMQIFGMRKFNYPSKSVCVGYCGGLAVFEMIKKCCLAYSTLSNMITLVVDGF